MSTTSTVSDSIDNNRNMNNDNTRTKNTRFETFGIPHIHDGSNSTRYRTTPYPSRTNSTSDPSVSTPQRERTPTPLSEQYDTIHEGFEYSIPTYSEIFPAGDDEADDGDDGVFLDLVRFSSNSDTYVYAISETEMVQGPDYSYRATETTYHTGTTVRAPPRETPASYRVPTAVHTEYPTPPPTPTPAPTPTPLQQSTDRPDPDAARDMLIEQLSRYEYQIGDERYLSGEISFETPRAPPASISTIESVSTPSLTTTYVDSEADDEATESVSECNTSEYRRHAARTYDRIAVSMAITQSLALSQLHNQLVLYFNPDYVMRVLAQFQPPEQPLDEDHDNEGSRFPPLPNDFQTNADSRERYLRRSYAFHYRVQMCSAFDNETGRSVYAAQSVESRVHSSLSAEEEDQSQYRPVIPAHLTEPPLIRNVPAPQEVVGGITYLDTMLDKAAVEPFEGAETRRRKSFVRFCKRFFEH